MSRIAVDLDGVVFDFAGTFVDAYNNWFGGTIDTFTQWDDIVTLTHFNTEAEAIQWASRAGLWGQLPYIAGAPGALDELSQTHQLVFVTARSGDAARATAEWHRRSPWSHIQLRTGQTNKPATPCGVYIDDNPGVIKTAVKAGKVGVVFDQPWNIDVECNNETSFRAMSWNDVIEIVGSL